MIQTRSHFKNLFNYCMDDLNILFNNYNHYKPLNRKQSIIFNNLKHI